MHKEALFFEDSLSRTCEILTQGSLSDSVSTKLNFVSVHGKQQKMNPSCGWSHSGENWQKCTKSVEYQFNGCNRDSSVEEPTDRFTSIKEVSRTYFDSSTINIHVSSTPIKDGFVYKRRKMQKNTIALLSGENAAEVTERNAVSNINLSSADYHLELNEDSSDDVPAAVADHSSDCQDNENLLFSGRNHNDVHIAVLMSQHIDIKNVESAQTCANNGQGSARDITRSAEESVSNLNSSSTGNCIAHNGACATSKSYVTSASISTMEREHNEDCSSSDAVPLESLDKFASLEEMCIYVLKRHSLLGETSRNRACVSSKNLGSLGPVFSPCKICDFSENVLKMLICDDCEEAFHLSCYRPKIKKLPADEWYCQSCFPKKRKHLLRKNLRTSGDISENGNRSIQDHMGPISSMLNGIGPHRSRVRISEEFQVEVPDWSGLITNDDDYFGDPKKMDHADFCSLEGWSWSKSFKTRSIGNWLQCQDEDDGGKKCGKWRRAPLFSVQINDWDCSCAVVWDPIHADCAVPQELDTKEVLKNLKYVEMLKTRLNNRVKPEARFPKY